MEAEYLYMNFLLMYKAEFDVKDACTEEQVTEIEKNLGVHLPRSYKEVYLILGKWHGFNVIDDNGYKFPDYKGMREEAKRIVASDGIEFGWDQNVFVCGVFRENGVFYFFKLDEGEDPPVYAYEGGSGDYIQTANSFSLFVQQQIWYEGFLIGKKLK